MYLRNLLGTMVMATASLASALEFHVAPRGSATGMGTKEFPFGTLEKARDAVAEARRQGLGKEGIVVWVHGGRYQRLTPFTLSAADGGAPGAPVIYQAVPGETPVLSGAQSLPLRAFFPVQDETVLERLPGDARKSVRVANLKAYQINDYGTLPVKFRGAVPVLELFCDGERMELARWPNRPDWAVIARIVDRGSTSKAPTPRRPGVFKYADPQHERWTNARHAYLNGYWCYDWFDECIKLGKVDPAEHTVTLAAPHGYGVGRTHTARRYYAFNLLEELDSPGEYYLDRDRGLLYFWPPKRARGPVYLSMLASPLIEVLGASDVRFEGLAVEHVRGNAIEIKDSQRVQIAGCTIRHTGGGGITVTGGESCRVDTCDLYDIGTAAVTLQGGDPKTLTPCHHRATNNHIHHFARRQRTYAGGITLKGVGLRADHNLIHDAPHSAIFASANDCLIEYNEVHDVCLETDDCGAFYKGRNPAWQGNVLRYNFWHHIGTPLGHGNNAIYFDDGDVGETVYGNVFYKSGRNSGGSMGAIFTHGGHANDFENNVFIDCDRAIGHSHWSDERWRDYYDPAKNAFMKKRLLEDVDITKPPYSDRYPSLHDFFNSWQRPRLNLARNNVAVRCEDFLSGEEYHTAESNLETDADPGFVDAAKMDFLLKPDSVVFAKLPDFKPIPFAIIGLKRSPLRAEWPVKHLPAKRVFPEPPEMPRIPLDEFAVRPGPPPVVDGDLDEAEWQATGMPVAVQENLQGGRSQFPSQAWLRYDREALFVAFENRVSTAKPMEVGGLWGTCDAVEISWQLDKQPIAVLRGFATGRFQSTPEASKDEVAAKRAGEGVVYAAKILGADRWVCEWRIPWTSLGVTPKAGLGMNVNLSVRKTATNEWTMLRSTGGSTWKVSEAAILRLQDTPPAAPPPKPTPPPAAEDPAPAPPAKEPKPEPKPQPKPVDLKPPKPVAPKPAAQTKPGPVLKDKPKPVPAPAPEPVPEVKPPPGPAAVPAPKPVDLKPPKPVVPQAAPETKLGPVLEEKPRPVPAPKSEAGVPPAVEKPVAPKPAPSPAPVPVPMPEAKEVPKTAPEAEPIELKPPQPAPPMPVEETKPGPVLEEKPKPALAPKPDVKAPAKVEKPVRNPEPPPAPAPSAEVKEAPKPESAELKPPKPATPKTAPEAKPGPVLEENPEPAPGKEPSKAEAKPVGQKPAKGGWFRRVFAPAKKEVEPTGAGRVEIKEPLPAPAEEKKDEE
jgi:hypothetical protein